MSYTPPGGPRADAVGKELRRLRLRRKLSQEKLAQRLHTDKAQISKRERGKHLPRRDTLQHYAHALGLDQGERRKLFELAGYSVGQSPVTPEDHKRVVETVRDEWLERPWPAAVVADTHWTLWHVNDSFARLFSSQAASRLTGKHMLELCFDPALGMHEALRRIAADAEIERFIVHMLARFRSQHSRALSEPWWAPLEERLLAFDRFTQAWENSKHMNRAGTVATLAYLNLTGGGRLVMVGGPARTDERFILALFLPEDVRSATMLERANEN